MTALLRALDESAPTGLDDVGGVWDVRIRDALARTLADPAERQRTMDGLTRERAWALLSWAEGACTWAVRRRSSALLRDVLGVLRLLDGHLDRRDLSTVASLARRASDLLGVTFHDLLRVSVGEPPPPPWLANASPELPPTHSEVGSGDAFEFRRRPAALDATALEELLRDDRP